MDGGGGTATICVPSVCFKVEKIIGVSQGYGNMRTYQVQWSPSWVSSAHLVGCDQLLKEFLNQQHPDIENSPHNVSNGGTAVEKSALASQLPKPNVVAEVEDSAVEYRSETVDTHCAMDVPTNVHDENLPSIQDVKIE